MHDTYLTDVDPAAVIVATAPPPPTTPLDVIPAEEQQ